MSDILTDADRLGLKWGRPDGVIVARSEFVAEARTWKGTPWVHQHEVKGRGVDCGGIVRGASVALGLIPSNYRHLMPEAIRGYARHPDGFLAQQLCDYYWRRIPNDLMQAGDIALIKFDRFPQHAAVLGSYPYGGLLSMIHAFGKCVVEHRLDESWRKKIVAAYSLPGVA